jgi:cardiolipin synthase
MWLANALTVARVPIAVVFWLTYGNTAASVGLVALAAATDAADGTVARWARRRTSETRPSAGEWLDPLADKLFVVLVLAAIQVHDPAPWWLLGLIVARELVLVPLAAVYRVVVHGRGEHAFQAGVLGKAATVAELFAIGALVVRSPIVIPLAIAAAGLGLAAVAQYILRASHTHEALEHGKA